VIQGGTATITTLAIWNSNGAVVDGFVLAGNHNGPVLTTLNSSATIAHNEIFGGYSSTGGGIQLGDGDYTITDNDIHNNKASSGGAIALFPSASDPIKITARILHNVIEENSGSSAVIAVVSASYPYMASAANMTLERNIIRDNHGTSDDALIELGSGTYAIRDNLMTGNQQSRYASSGLLHLPAQSTLSFTNNTVVANNFTADLMSFYQVDSQMFANNIFAFNNARLGVGTNHKNETFYQNTNTPTVSGTNKIEDPLFVNAAAGDYHLLPNSPCVDTGDDSVLATGETDLDGRPRIAGAHVDRGAYEYVADLPYTMADAAVALRIAGGLAPWDARRDITGDGTVDIRDAVGIARAAVGTNP
jgi:hypothetical protein